MKNTILVKMKWPVVPFYGELMSHDLARHIVKLFYNKRFFAEIESESIRNRLNKIIKNFRSIFKEHARYALN